MRQAQTGGQVTEEKKQFLLSIRGEDPLQAGPPFYSNFVSIARLGTDVQLEFIFVDINRLALMTEAAKKTGNYESQEITGKTVAKIVMPGLSFIQIKDHLNVLFKALEEALQAQEVNDELSTDARPSSSSGVR
jgi:hypothetical protein